jgi:predicted DNA-binding antitoxin AbrB/MazE fold protein
MILVVVSCQIEYNIYNRTHREATEMPTIKAIYDGAVFVPIESLDVKKGQRVQLVVSSDGEAPDYAAEKLAAFRRITNNLRRLNETEPLPPEFDEIMSMGVNFSTEVEL